MILTSVDCALKQVRKISIGSLRCIYQILHDSWYVFELKKAICLKHNVISRSCSCVIKICHSGQSAANFLSYEAFVGTRAQYTFFQKSPDLPKVTVVKQAKKRQEGMQYNKLGVINQFLLQGKELFSFLFDAIHMWQGEGGVGSLFTQFLCEVMRDLIFTSVCILYVFLTREVTQT